MFHRHNWVEQERFFAAPVAGQFEATGYVVALMAFGQTTITYRCKCGEINVKELLGKATV